MLHSPNARVGAIDLESKFTEAAIGNLHYADWRNFAHGRHHWLAKRGKESAIVALIGDDDEKLAERTLALIPDEVRVSRLRLPGTPEAVALGALAASPDQSEGLEQIIDAVLNQFIEDRRADYPALNVGVGVVALALMHDV